MSLNNYYDLGFRLGVPFLHAELGLVGRLSLSVGGKAVPRKF